MEGAHFATMEGFGHQWVEESDGWHTEPWTQVAGGIFCITASTCTTPLPKKFARACAIHLHNRFASLEKDCVESDDNGQEPDDDVNISQNMAALRINRWNCTSRFCSSKSLGIATTRQASHSRQEWREIIPQDTQKNKSKDLADAPKKICKDDVDGDKKTQPSTHKQRTLGQHHSTNPRKTQNSNGHIDCTGETVMMRQQGARGVGVAGQSAGRQVQEQTYDMSVCMRDLVRMCREKQNAKVQKKAEKAHKDQTTGEEQERGSAGISLVEMQAPEGDSRISAMGVGVWRAVEITIDSGACDTVMPVGMCPGIGVHESENQRKGLEYEVASGETIANEGGKRCLLMTVGAKVPKRITFQLADVHKPLLSVTKVADAGYECHRNSFGGYLLDTFTGESVPIQRKGSLYTMWAWVKEDNLRPTVERGTP